MRLREANLAVFSRSAEASFERRMLNYLRRTFVVTVSSLGDAETLACVRYGRGRERARTHGVTSERGVCRWVHLMFVFGRDFDREPSVAWASKVLARDDFSGPTALVACLFAHGMMHVSEGRGIGSRAPTL